MCCVVRFNSVFFGGRVPNDCLAPNRHPYKSLTVLSGIIAQAEGSANEGIPRTTKSMEYVPYSPMDKDMNFLFT